MPDPVQLWPIFICYRRVDGAAVARRLHEMLDKWQTEGPGGSRVQLDVYLDETMPGVADWHALHQPYLEKARALIVICTPGAKLNEGPGDWVHREIDWWLEHRETAPILIDALKEGIRYVPAQIVDRWPEIQRIAIVEEEWKALTAEALEEKTAAVRRQVIGALLPSGAAVYAEELEDERRRTRRLRVALAAAAALLGATTTVGGYAYVKRRAAERSERTAEASLLDARAAGDFAQSRLVDARYEVETNRRNDLLARIASPAVPAAPDTASEEDEAFDDVTVGEDEDGEAIDGQGVRLENLRHELAQVNEDLRRLKAEAARLRRQGHQFLQQADEAWKSLPKGRRSRPAPPYVFSIELINAGPGESILIHYGSPDDLRLVMINGGPKSTYAAFVEPRLRELRDGRHDGKPVVIERFIAGDQDADKVQGLVEMLRHIAATPDRAQRLVDVRGIWANVFRVENRRGLREDLRRLIGELRIPLNEPFDHWVMRPERGTAVIALPGGLEITVLGPARDRLVDLYKMTARRAREGGAIEPWTEEAFSKVRIDQKPAPLSAPVRAEPASGDCRPSGNAEHVKGGANLDKSVPNLASTVLLFRFRGRTFLHTGDSRGDFILAGLQAAGLLDEDGRAHVDMLSIPHSGSDRNVTLEFFEKVRADGYLFSGDGRYSNPDIGTVATLVTARGCDSYRMYFVNRDGAEDAHGAKLDAFFRGELAYKPNYRRIFRSAERGSVMINLLDPVRY